MNITQGDKCFIYARKSSESIDRQVQSIPDQLKVCKELEQKYPCELLNIFSEACSATEPYGRPEFELMMQAIERGEVSVIITWHTNRLARNVVDNARLQHVLMKNIIKYIITPDRVYTSAEALVVLGIEGAMATQFIVDLVKVTKRGSISKVQKGWAPNAARVGYMNKLDDHTIVRDPERFDNVKEMWEMLLSEQYTVPQIHKVFSSRGFTTRQGIKKGGKVMGLSQYYSMFSSPFYCGKFPYAGELYEGQHEAMISPESFEKAQIILGKKSRPRPSKHVFPFTGLVRCGECGCMITAETKHKLLSDNKTIRSYTYYHCTYKSKTTACSQPSITSEDLEQQLMEHLSGITIEPRFFEWAKIEMASKLKNRLDKEREAIQQQDRHLVVLQNDKSELVQMRLKKLINDEEFMQLDKDIKAKITAQETIIERRERAADKVEERLEDTLNLAANALDIFNSSDLKTTKAMLLGIGQNFTLKDRKLSIDLYPWFIPLKTVTVPQAPSGQWLELVNDRSSSELVTISADEIQRWQAYPDSN